MNKVKGKHDLLLARAEELVDEARKLTQEMQQLVARRDELLMRLEHVPQVRGGGPR